MMNKIKTFLGFNPQSESKTDFSEFFYSASSAEKKKLLQKVVKDANKDQRDMVSKSNQVKTI